MNTSESFKVFIDETFLVDCQFGPVPSMEVNEYCRNYVLIKKTLRVVLNALLPSTVAYEYFIEQLETITVLR